MDRNELGLVHIYTGNGKGKSSAAIGQGIRAVGAGLKVAMVCFFKNQNTSEYVTLQRLSPQFQLFFPSIKYRDFFWRLSEADKTELSVEYQKMWEKITSYVSNRSFDLLILDEIIPVVNYEIISKSCLIEMIHACRSHQIELILTGRDASDELAEQADLITEMKEIKHPWHLGAKARRGIEF